MHIKINENYWNIVYEPFYIFVITLNIKLTSCYRWSWVLKSEVITLCIFPKKFCWNVCALSSPVHLSRIELGMHKLHICLLCSNACLFFFFFLFQFCYWNRVGFTFWVRVLYSSDWPRTLFSLKMLLNSSCSLSPKFLDWVLVCGLVGWSVGWFNVAPAGLDLSTWPGWPWAAAILLPLSTTPICPEVRLWVPSVFVVAWQKEC